MLRASRASFLLIEGRPRLHTVHAPQPNLLSPALVEEMMPSPSITPTTLPDQARHMEGCRHRKSAINQIECLDFLAMLGSP